MGRGRAGYLRVRVARNGRYLRLVWWADGRQRSIGIGRNDGSAETARRAQALATELQAAVNGDAPWPDWARAPLPDRAQPEPAADGAEDTGVLADDERLDAALTADAETLATYRDAARRELASPGSHLQEVAAWAAWLAAARLPLAEVDAPAVTRWLDAECAARGLADASRNRYRSAVSRLYRWLGERGLCEANPVAGVATRTERVRRRILYLERDERDRLLLAGADLPDIIAAWLACYAGLRRRELARLPWSAVRWEAERLHVAETKGGRPRVVELAPALLAELQRLRPDRPRGRIVDWPAAEPRWKWRADLLLDRLRERAVAVGICPGRIGWHTWRHSYGTHLAQAGAPIEYICSQLGNTSTVAREHYLSFIPAAGATGWAARL